MVEVEVDAVFFASLYLTNNAEQRNDYLRLNDRDSLALLLLLSGLENKDKVIWASYNWTYFLGTDSDWKVCSSR